MIIISACYSGSLIGDLRAPERIIITAARADRSSFGCAAGNRHTFFGEAELHAFGQPDRSLHQVFTAIRDDVAAHGSGARYPPSEPQVSVGARCRGSLRRAGVLNDRHQRSGRKNARISVASASGCSIAAKWPPRGITVQRRMSV